MRDRVTSLRLSSQYEVVCKWCANCKQSGDKWVCAEGVPYYAVSPGCVYYSEPGVDSSHSVMVIREDWLL